MKGSQLKIRSTVFQTQRRYMEYFGMGVTPRQQPYVYGENLPKTLNKAAGEKKKLSDSVMLTGSNFNIPISHSSQLSEETIREDSKHGNLYAGPIGRYAVPPVRISQRIACHKALSSKIDPSAVFQTLFRDYPGLSKPLDATTQSELYKAL
eukprot:PhF_6_TR4930/c0_g1_i1/m.6989